MERTRNAYKCPIFGDTCDFKTNMLPTYEDVMKCYEWTRHNLKISKKEPTLKEISDIVCEKIEFVWKQASLPIVSTTRSLQMIKSYHGKCKQLLKFHPNIPKKKLEKFVSASKVLFDISSCKCSDFSKCNCSKERKVPPKEIHFLDDQRTRKMIIGNTDVIATKNNRKSLKRKLDREKSSTCLAETSTSVSGPILNNSPTNSPSDSFEETVTDSEDLFTVNNKEKKKKQQKSVTLNYSALSQTCDRYGVSDRAAAAIASVILQESQLPIIDKSKLRRERKKARESVQKQESVSEISALYFDGRKDKTLVNQKKNGKYYREQVVEEHISLISEPESKYLGYIAPTSGTAKCVEEELYEYFLTEKISLEKLVAIGCDGTNVNVGKFGGIIRLLEKRLNRPLQWIVCMLHMNELPFRHLFAHVDGVTSGPRTFSGVIGKGLENCEKTTIVKFKSIPGESLPIIDTKNLSSDQLYLFNIVSAVLTGSCPEDLADKSPGKMSHARWLTKANRVLRLYIGTIAPTESLNILANYVVKVYAPTWFNIKSRPTCKDGPRHLWDLISKTRCLSPELQTVIDPVIKRNSFFAHSENILLAMLTDPEKHIRELSLRRILKARTEKSNRLRVFEVPNIKMDAKVYYDLIDWQKDIFDPPILKHISDDELQYFIGQEENNHIEFLRLPCHTQAVERAVKTVTEASATLCTKQAREGFIKSKIVSRKLMPKFDSKKDFCIN